MSVTCVHARSSLRQSSFVVMPSGGRKIATPFDWYLTSNSATDQECANFRDRPYEHSSAGYRRGSGCGGDIEGTGNIINVFRAAPVAAAPCSTAPRGVL